MSSGREMASAAPTFSELLNNEADMNFSEVLNYDAEFAALEQRFAGQFDLAMAELYELVDRRIKTRIETMEQRIADRVIQRLLAIDKRQWGPQSRIIAGRHC